MEVTGVAVEAVEEEVVNPASLSMTAPAMGAAAAEPADAVVPEERVAPPEGVLSGSSLLTRQGSGLCRMKSVVAAGAPEVPAETVAREEVEDWGDPVLRWVPETSAPAVTAEEAETETTVEAEEEAREATPTRSTE
jgi:hypothetical protein